MSEICERLQEEAALLGRLPESEEMRAHAEACAECSAFLARLGELERDLASLRERDASDDLVAATLARVEGRRRRNLRPWAISLASAASLFVAVQVWRGATLEDRSLLREPAPAPERETRDEPRKELDRIGSVSDDEQKLLSKTEATDELRQQGKAGKKDSAAVGGIGGRVDEGLLLDDKNQPLKRANRLPEYPEDARKAKVSGTVVLELTVDREGNVTDVRVIESIPLLDQAAIDAVRDWKYAPSDEDAPRVFRVPVPFRPIEKDEPQVDEDRSRVDGLPFQEAKGYWANTYLPGDPLLRALESRLRETSYPRIHEGALPISLPYDPTSPGALSLFLHSDRKGVNEKTRLLVQVGIRAGERQGRRRPPMNVSVVLDLAAEVAPETASAVTALLESLESSQESGDRFRILATGRGEILAPETFRRGPLTVALQDLYNATASGSVSDALALALEKVHAGDDPTMPLGTSLVVFVSGRSLGNDIRELAPMAQASAAGGVAVSVIGLGTETDGAVLDRLALAGQGRRYDLTLASQAPAIVDAELSSTSRVVARAIRLRIRLAEGVRLVDVLGSHPLDARASEQVRNQERAIDRRLARNLGIEADRGRDEDGIQIVIPAFYAGDAHSILLDVVADGPGPIAEVTARYKDLVRLENTVARASLSLFRSEEPKAALETMVENDYREGRVADALLAASEALDRGELGTASTRLQHAMSIARDRDRSLLQDYLRAFPQLPPDYLRDSLLYASALKRAHIAS
jgi:TonB family protein